MLCPAITVVGGMWQGQQPVNGKAAVAFAYPCRQQTNHFVLRQAQTSTTSNEDVHSSIQNI